MSEIDETPYVGDVMSNFDCELDKDVAGKLVGGNCHAGHCAWNFHGTVWYEGGKFHERVMRYGSVAGTLTANSVDELTRAVNDEYGWE